MTTALTCSVQETADLLGVSERHVRTLVENGTLAKVPHLGRAVRIPRIVVEALVASASTASVFPTPHRVEDEVVDGGTAPGSSGKSASAGPSTSEQSDGPVREHRAIEERAAYSAQKAG